MLNKCWGLVQLGGKSPKNHKKHFAENLCQKLAS